MTSASRAITFEGSLTIHTLPVKRWSQSESLSTVHNPRSTLSLLSGLGTFGAVHEHLDFSLRNPRSPILHRVVVGASVPTPFPPRCLTGVFALNVQPSLATPIATSSTPLLIHRG
ncbi:hypothetical protein CRG98_012630 [Punica granatum]|uniref:Uncharacterized protein n=1 Tax=Punica granatum TaxID=22663 RepID=A0A2I0KEN0_PUNGR|nr:hypothetical protein CRG98_012630 [Punica granatum]